MMINRGLAPQIRWMVVAVLICLGWTGCATAPPPVELPASLNLPRKMKLSGVPFFPQGEYQCGPASLAMTLQWSGIMITPEQLKPEVYTPNRRGSLPPDMIGAARRHGRIAYPVRSIENILKEVAAGHPVIVLQRLSSWVKDSWHYAVVIGYDLDRRELILHSGIESGKVWSIDAFAQTWRPWGRWGILSLPPDEFPATVIEEVYLKAVMGLERTRHWAEAGEAYARAAERWPHNTMVWVGLGNSRHSLGDLEGAEQAFRTAVAEDPRSGAAYNNLAHVLMELGRTEEALTMIDHAIRLGGPLADVFQKTRGEIQQRIKG